MGKGREVCTCVRSYFYEFYVILQSHQLTINRLQFREMCDSQLNNRRFRHTPQRFSHFHLSSSVDKKYLPSISPLTPNHHRNTNKPQPNSFIHSHLQQNGRDSSNTCPVQYGTGSQTFFKQKSTISSKKEQQSLSISQHCNQWLQKNYIRIKNNVSHDKRYEKDNYLKLSQYSRKQAFQSKQDSFDKNKYEDKFNRTGIQPIKPVLINDDHLTRQISITQASETGYINKSQNRYQSLNNNKKSTENGLNKWCNNNVDIGVPSPKLKFPGPLQIKAPNHYHYFKKSRIRIEEFKINKQQNNINQPSLIPFQPPIKYQNLVQQNPIQQPKCLGLVSLESNAILSLSNIGYYGQSFKGKRPYNQDRYICQVKGNATLRNKLTNLSYKIDQNHVNHLTDISDKHNKTHNQISLSNKYCLFGVFDGHGGAKCAQFIKQNIGKMLSINRNLYSNPGQALKQTLNKLQQKFIQLCQKRGHLETSGSCAVVCLVSDKVYIGNVGDSRAILLGPNSVSQITKDHKPDDKDQKARIIRNGGKLYKDGSVLGVEGKENIKVFNQTRIMPGSLNVSRTLGDIQVKFKKFGGLPGIVTPEPDIFTLPFTQHQSYLILASDGLFEGLTNQQILTVYKKLQLNELSRKCPHSEESITTQLVKQLIKKASQKSGDNITVVCIKLPCPNFQGQ